ncbi:MAG: DNA-processing protein DprA [Pseudomonadota bacterium]
MQARLDLRGARAAPAGGVAADQPLEALRLARSRNVGPSTFLRLLRRFGTPAAALEALPELARRGGARGPLSPSREAAEREMEAAAAAGARLIVWGAPDYPPALAEISDPPPVMWLRGEAAPLARPAVAVVGSRNASAVGLRMARALAGDLSAAGFPVISGLARGIDGAAHEAALEGGTAAVLAGCVAKVYPAEHAALAERIAQGGALVSEAPMGLEPQARHFPRRNRVIAGLSRAVVLIEAAARSGSLITADFALEQGREVMAVPGSPLDPRSAGGNELIRQGATLVRHAGDIAEALESLAARSGFAEPAAPGPRAAPAPVASEREDAELRAEVAGLLGVAPVEEDELARLSGASLSALADALMELELAGRLDRRPGGYLALLPGGGD